MTMYQVAIGADIQTSDGASIGKVEHLIVESDTKELSGIVADKGIFDQGRVIDLEYVQALAEDVVKLSLSAEEAKRMPGFASHEFVRVGDSTREYDPGSEPFIGAPGGIWMPSMVGAVGIPGAGAGMSYAPAAPTGSGPEVVGPLTASEVVLDKGTDVVDASGDKVGTVDEVLFGEDDRVAGFVVEQGFLFHHDVWVPTEWIASITHEHVQLNVSKDQVEQSRQNPR